MPAEQNEWTGPTTPITAGLRAYAVAFAWHFSGSGPPVCASAWLQACMASVTRPARKPRSRRTKATAAFIASAAGRHEPASGTSETIRRSGSPPGPASTGPQLRESTGATSVAGSSDPASELVAAADHGHP